MRHTGVPNRAWTRPLVTSLLPAVVLLAVVACGDGDNIDLSAVYDVRLGETPQPSPPAATLSSYRPATWTMTCAGPLKWETASSLRTALQRRPARKQEMVWDPHTTHCHAPPCHSHDGRGKPPDNADDPERGLLLRLSIPGPNGPVAEPTYGGQLQDRSILGVPAEGSMLVAYVEAPGRYPDGTEYSLRQPTYSIGALAFGPLHPQVQISPRIAPAVIGMGLLEAIPEASIAARADPNDANNDGISGRPNYVWDILRGELALGRFGWKGKPTHGGTADCERVSGRHWHYLNPVPRRKLSAQPGGLP